jgi:hypothetical protein
VVFLLNLLFNHLKWRRESSKPSDEEVPSDSPAH